MKWIVIIALLIPIVWSIDINDAFGQSCTNETSRKICGEQLICLNKTCTNCNEDTQCSSTTNIVCKDVDDIISSNLVTNPNITHVCDHKDIFTGVNGYDVGAIILIFLVGLFAAITGIGGGGFYVVILQIMLEMDISFAARISSAMIFGISIVNFIHYSTLRHTFQDKPMVDFNTAILTESFMLSGTIFGVIINQTFPNWLISFLLVLILVFVGAKILHQYQQLNKKGKQKTDVVENDIEMSSFEEIEIKTKSIAVKAVKEETLSKYYTLPKVSILILCWILIVMFSIFKGGKSSDSLVGVERCSGTYWGLIVVQFLIIFTVGISFGFYLFYKFKKRDINSLQKGDVKWTKKNSLVLPPFLIIGGLVASTFGVGGGTLKTPIMLQLKMLPNVIVATTGYSLIFTASSSLIQYFLFGVLPIDYAIVFILVGFTSSLTGHLIIGYIIKKRGKPRYLLLILGILTIIISAVALGYSIYRLAIDVKDDINIGFKSLC